MARHHPMRRGEMAGISVRDRADEGNVPHRPGEMRQMFADFHAANIGRNRTKLTADFRRGFRFQIVQVDMARASPHEDLNHGGIVGGVLGSGTLGPAAEIVRHSKRAERQRADLQRGTAGDLPRDSPPDCFGDLMQSPRPPVPKMSGSAYSSLFHPAGRSQGVKGGFAGRVRRSLCISSMAVVCYAIVPPRTSRFHYAATGTQWGAKKASVVF